MPRPSSFRFCENVFITVFCCSILFQLTCFIHLARFKDWSMMIHIDLIYQFKILNCVIKSWDNTHFLLAYSCFQYLTITTSTAVSILVHVS